MSNHFGAGMDGLVCAHDIIFNAKFFLMSIMFFNVKKSRIIKYGVCITDISAMHWIKHDLEILLVW